MRNLKIYAILFTVAFQAFGQEVKRINLDFKSKTSSLNAVECIREGDYYQVVIKNINLNLYKVTMNSTDTVLSKAISAPTSGSLEEIDLLAQAFAGLKSMGTLVTQAVAATSPLPGEFLVMAGPPSNETDSINVRLSQESYQLQLYWTQLSKISNSIDSIQSKAYETQLYSLKTEVGAPTAQNFDIDKALKSIAGIRDTIVSLQGNVYTSRQVYQEYSQRNKKAIAAAEKTTIDEKIGQAYEKLVDATAKVWVKLNSDQVKESLSAIVFLRNNSEATFTSLPIQFRGDQAKVMITIAPRDEKYLLQTYTTEVVFPPRQKAFLIVGLSFYWATLYDEEYSTIVSSTSDSFLVVPEAIEKSEIGISSLIHFGMKFNNKKSFGGHLCFGPGVSISKDIKPRLFWGGGLVFGKRQMFALNTGMILGYTERKSSAIDLDQKYAEKPENITVSKLQVGIYISCGYLFSF